MATLTIGDVDDELETQLRTMAAEHDRSVEEEVRAILRSAVIRHSNSEGLATQIHRQFADFHREFGDPGLKQPDRTELARPAEFPE